LKNKYEDSLAELRKSYAEIEKLNVLNKKLVEVKDKDESFKIILESSSEWEKVKILAGQLKEILSKLSCVVAEALYYYSRREVYRPASDDWEQVQSAVEYNYFSSFDPEAEDPLELNEHEPSIKKATILIDTLREFFEEEASANFCEAFISNYGFDPIITNRRFWEKFLL